MWALIIIILTNAGAAAINTTYFGDEKACKQAQLAIGVDLQLIPGTAFIVCQPTKTGGANESH
jgi:hypothetical protein